MFQIRIIQQLYFVKEHTDKEHSNCRQLQEHQSSEEDYLFLNIYDLQDTQQRHPAVYTKGIRRLIPHFPILSKEFRKPSAINILLSMEKPDIVVNPCSKGHSGYT